MNDSWQIRDRPFTLDELRCLYADSCSDSTWHPLYFDQLHAYTHPEYPDSLFYFSRHGYNRSELGVSTPIVKSYPGARDPRTGPASQLTDDDYTDDGYLKYFEYEMEITNLLSTIPYYVGVTAYDFGHPDEALPTLESNLDSTLVELLPHSRSVGSEGDKVYVYPNPYRGDQRYHLHGYEGRNDDRFHERTRRIYFRNLPPQCVIRIHSLDGDLIDEIVHDRTPSDPNADNDYWDVITRSELRPVSGLYYWSVESPDGEVQIGKLMLIF